MEAALPVEAGRLLSFVVTAFLIELTPGPNMTYLALISAQEGRRRGFATVVGIALGLAVVGLVAALGVAELVQASGTLYEGLRWAGVVFLLYLAWEGWRGEGDVAGTPGEADRRYFLRGLITNLLNPKAAVFYMAVLPTFVDGDRPVFAQTLLLTTAYVSVATTVHALIVLLASRLEPYLNDPEKERVARRVLSALLAGVALWFAWSTAR